LTVNKRIFASLSANVSENLKTVSEGVNISIARALILPPTHSSADG
jgi:hypothetical protein